MKIAESAIQLYSQHTSLEKDEKSESLTIWRTGQNQRPSSDDRGIKTTPGILSNPSVKVSLSHQAGKAGKPDWKTVTDSDGSDAPSDLNLRLLQMMIEKITGKKIDLTDLKKIFAKGTAESMRLPDSVAQQKTEQAPSAGFGLIYESHETHQETESTSFSAQGKIVTEDGREIDFSTQLAMSRSFTSQQDLSIRMGDALKDPLVINFNGKAADLTQTHFSFDLNNDGSAEDMAFVAPGSGFLALDKNGDNMINNGSELFGPATGNGFDELASYDSDGNNWIDENDPVFNKLRVWTKDENGQDSLISLGQTGVGALYLGNVSTPFSLKNADNDLMGQVRNSGIFVQENGVVGTLQQIDLVA